MLTIREPDGILIYRLTIKGFRKEYCSVCNSVREVAEYSPENQPIPASELVKYSEQHRQSFQNSVLFQEITRPARVKFERMISILQHYPDAAIVSSALRYDNRLYIYAINGVTISAELGCIMEDFFKRDPPGRKDPERKEFPFLYYPPYRVKEYYTEWQLYGTTTEAVNELEQAIRAEIQKIEQKYQISQKTIKTSR